MANRACFTPSLNYFTFFAFLLSLFWTCTVLSNVVYTTVSGAVSTWWGVSSDYSDPCRTSAERIKSAVYESFIRSITQSFGSICLGSLFVAILKAARSTLHFFYKQLYHVLEVVRPSDYDACGVSRYLNWIPSTLWRTPLTWVLDGTLVLLDILDRALVYFNRYALVYVALRGDSFVEASKYVAICLLLIYSFKVIESKKFCLSYV